MVNSKGYMKKGINLIILLFTYHMSVTESAGLGLDNTLIPPSVRFYKYQPSLTFGLSYGSGGNPGYYDSEGNQLSEQQIDFNKDTDLPDFTEAGLLLFRDTLDKVDRLWDTEYTFISANIAYGSGDFLFYARLPFMIRNYNEKIIGVEYDPAIVDQLVIRRKEEGVSDIESSARFENIDFGFRYTVWQSDSLNLYLNPQVSASTVPSEELFGNRPSVFYLPVGVVYNGESSGFLLEAGYAIREGGMSDQFWSEASIYFTNVPKTLLFVDLSFAYSLDESTEPFRRFYEPISPSFFVVAPGFNIVINDNLDLNIRYRVDLWNKSNYGMSRFTFGANLLLE